MFIYILKSWAVNILKGNRTKRPLPSSFLLFSLSNKMITRLTTKAVTNPRTQHQRGAFLEDPGP